MLSFFIAVAFASNATGNATSASNGTANGILVTPPITIQATNATIAIADNAVIERVGSSYFGSYIKMTSAKTYLYANGTNTSDIAYSYSIPYKNGTTVSGYLQYGGLVATLNLNVHMTGNVITDYFGPSAPYFITVNEQSAANAAHSYGFNNITGIYVTAAYANRTAIAGPYQIAWAVLDGSYVQLGNCSNGCKVHPGVYVNTSTGAVEGEYAVNPLIRGTANPTYAILGDTSIFKIPAPQTNASALLFESIGIRIALIGLVVFIIMFIVSRRRKVPNKARRIQ